MNLEELKRKAADAAARVLANDSVRRAVDVAYETGHQVADELKNLGDEVRRQLDANRDPGDDTAALKERLDRLRSEAADSDAASPTEPSDDGPQTDPSDSIPGR